MSDYFTYSDYHSSASAPSYDATHDTSAYDMRAGEARAEVGSRSYDTMSSAAETPTTDTATSESHHHGGVLAAIVNIVEVVINLVIPSGSTPASGPTAPPGQMIDPGTGQPFTPPTYGKPDSHW